MLYCSHRALELNFTRVG